MSDLTPIQLVDKALDKGLDVDQLGKLLEMQEKWEAMEAKKAYTQAMNKFKADPPEIFKNKEVKYKQTEYSHASLDHVSAVVAERLSEYGLRHHWEQSKDENGLIKVTCIITHSQGHSEQTSLSAGLDQTGGKNNIQALGSTVTYLQRYTLLSITGLAAKDMDDDGKTAETEVVGEEQIQAIKDLLKEKGRDEEKLIDWLKTRGIDEIGKIPLSEYETIYQKIAK